LLPTLTTTEPVTAVLTSAVLDVSRLLADELEEFYIGGEVLDAVESSNEVK
jgi:hypothetical protein